MKELLPYYERELVLLRLYGQEFAGRFPKVAAHPQFTESLLEMLFPHYLRPFPSCAVARAEPSERHQNEWLMVPRGTALESAPVQGVRCQFRSAYDLALGPLRLEAASFGPCAANGADFELQVHPRLAEEGSTEYREHSLANQGRRALDSTVDGRDHS